GDDVGVAVAVHVAGRDADAAGEMDVAGHEVHQHRVVFAAEGDDVGAAALVGADDDVGEAVAVEVAGRHVLAAGEARVVGEELADQVAGAAVVDVDVRPAARPGGRDHVRDAVAGHVAHRHAHAAGEGGRVGEEVELHG